MKTRIQELRKDQKVTQMELAESVGVTRQTIISLPRLCWPTRLRSFLESQLRIFLYLIRRRKTYDRIILCRKCKKR